MSDTFGICWDCERAAIGPAGFCDSHASALIKRVGPEQALYVFRAYAYNRHPEGPT